MNAAPQRDRSHLENSWPLPWDAISTAPAWPALLEALLADLEAQETRRRRRRGADRQRLADTLQAFVLALFCAHKRDPECWLAYSRNSSDYGPKARYWLPGATLTATQSVVDYLTAAGLAEHRRGFYDRSRNPFGTEGQGFRSRIRGTATLAARLEAAGVTKDSLGLADWAEVIRLKAPPARRGGSKPLAPYGDTEATDRMRERLRSLNAFLASFDLRLEGEAHPRPQPRLYRVFNNGRWDHGGRFYGGWWQAIPKADRKRILIDGEETVELDFRSLHPRLCYALQGQPLPAEIDPYAIEGMEGDERRELVKRAFNQLLNASPGTRPKPPEGAREKLPGGWSWQALLARIERAHSALARWFRASRGVELQFIDSQIAAGVMDYLRHRGVCCLPIHDSFIVPASAETVLGETMSLAYNGVLSGFTDTRSWPVISGWRSIEARNTVAARLARLQPPPHNEPAQPSLELIR